MTDIPALAAGDIRRARVTYRLADGGQHQEWRHIVLWDVRPDDPREQARVTSNSRKRDRCVRVLWQMLDVDGRPTGEPSWADLDGSLSQVDRTGIHIIVDQRVGEWDRNLDRLRDGAIARVVQLEDYRSAHLPADVAEAATAARQAEQAAEVARRHRDELIRRRRAEGMGVHDLAHAAGLHVQRIYQIVGEKRPLEALAEGR